MFFFDIRRNVKYKRVCQIAWVGEWCGSDFGLAGVGSVGPKKPGVGQNFGVGSMRP